MIEVLVRLAVHSRALLLVIKGFGERRLESNAPLTTRQRRGFRGAIVLYKRLPSGHGDSPSQFPISRPYDRWG